MLSKAILATLVYYDIFDYPLKKEEIHQFIPLRTKLNIQKHLDILRKKKKILQKNGFYFLPKREEIVLLRERRERYSKNKIIIAKNIAFYLSFIPWVEMIAITGTLAMKNARLKDDIDLLIITKTKRLWLTRILVTLILEILRKRRGPRTKETKDKICLNLFLDEKALKLPKNKRNLFIAHELYQIRPILNRQQTYEKFLASNQWVAKFLPNALDKVLISFAKKPKKRLKKLGFFDFLEDIFYKLQIKYMESKKTIEEVSPHFAFFHPQNQTDLILEKYKNKISQNIG